MADYHEYDPTQYPISLAGIPIKGFADGEFITIEQESDDFTDTVGTDGEVTRERTSDGRATVTFKLMQTAESNTALSALNNLDRNTPGGAGVGVFQMRDLLGNTLYRATKAWIAKPPDVSMDRKATTREWKIRVAKLNRVDGNT